MGILDTCYINPFTLRVPLRGIVCYFNTFENNLGIKQKFTKYLLKSCCLALINISPSNIFQKMLLIEIYIQNFQACFGLSECEWVNPHIARRPVYCIVLYFLLTVCDIMVYIV